MRLFSASRLRQKPSDAGQRTLVSFSGIVQCVIVALIAPNQTQQQPEELLVLSPQVFHVMLALAGGEQHGYAIMPDVA